MIATILTLLILAPALIIFLNSSQEILIIYYILSNHVWQYLNLLYWTLNPPYPLLCVLFQELPATDTLNYEILDSLFSYDTDTFFVKSAVRFNLFCFYTFSVIFIIFHSYYKNLIFSKLN